MKTVVVVVAAAVLAASAVAYAPTLGSDSIAIRRAPAIEVVSEQGRFVNFREASERRFVVFGYTRCRDACPLVLAQLTRRLQTRAHHDARVLFVTTDPQHDTPPVLKAYVRPWNGVVEGITGSPVALASIYESLTGAPRLPRAADHDSRVFFVDAAGDAVVVRDAGTFPEPEAALPPWYIVRHDGHLGSAG